MTDAQFARWCRLYMCAAMDAGQVEIREAMALIAKLAKEREK